MDTRFGFVSTYPPTRCGIATFTSSLMGAIRNLGSYTTQVVRLVESLDSEACPSEAPEIISTMVAGDPDSIIRAINALNNMDVAIVQHEFGIYAGDDGQEVLALLQGLRIPSIAVLHTVPATPSVHQRNVLMEVCQQVSSIVTMSMAARNRLVAGYEINPSKISVIPHGARAIATSELKRSGAPPLILTWGLIGPGKGIEWAIAAMAQLRNLNPAPRYVVAGHTHPKVFARERESYRESLQRRINELHLADSVELRADYLNGVALDELISSSSVVLLPYDSTDQMTSGVLIEAISARRPIIATEFPHAVEMLAGGAGILVPHRDPTAIAEAIRRILIQPELAETMSRRSGAIATELLWPSVASRYVQLARTLIGTRAVA